MAAAVTNGMQYCNYGISSENVVQNVQSLFRFKPFLMKIVIIIIIIIIIIITIMITLKIKEERVLFMQ